MLSKMKMSFLVLTVLVVELCVSWAHAAEMKEINAMNFTCAQLKTIVKKEKIVMLTMPGWGGRFAVSKKHCESRNHGVGNAYLRAKDTNFCNPGLWCRTKFPNE